MQLSKGVLYRIYRDSLQYCFISAWNEWGEGMYLEPDEKNRYCYLEALSETVEYSKKILIICARTNSQLIDNAPFKKISNGWIR